MYQAVIVDDEPAVVQGLQTALDWSGYNFTIAYATSNPLDALEYLRQRGDQIHLMITDVSMPELDGIGLLQKAKEMYPLLFVLMLSAHDNFEYVRAALRCGAENYLLKPLNPEELAESVSQIVQNMEKRSQLSAIYGTSLLSFRHSFTGSWVEGTLSPAELMSKAEVLGLNSEASGHRVVIFSLSGDDPGRMSEFFDQLLSQIFGRFQGHFFFKTPTMLVSVLVPLSEPSEPLEDFIGDIASQNTDIFCAVGPLVEHYSAVSDSYQKAKSYLFLQHTGIPVADAGRLDIPEDRAKALSAALEMSDPEGFQAALETLLPAEGDFAPAGIYLLRQLVLPLQDQDGSIRNHSPETGEILARFPAEEASREVWLRYLLAAADSCRRIQQDAAQTMYPVVNAVIDIIKEQPQEEMSLKTLARRLKVSPSYLGSLFRQQTGYYFSDYLTQYRLGEAARLIRTTNLKMMDIVERTGFSSQTYFNRLFKRNFGVSPVAYRRENALDTLANSETAGNR